jgi:hypothetical protein
VSEDFDGILQGTLSANVTRPYHQPETYVELDVGHVIACAWNWVVARCHGLVGKCVESNQQILFPYQPQFEYRKILYVWMQWVELHQLGKVVGTPSTHKKGYVHQSYEGLNYIYVEHKEGSHPMCEDVWSCMFSRYAQSSY